MHRYSGFTLIELAIVLVIIGLVVGGLLTGRDLIFNAAVKNQMMQIQNLELQMETFRTKYECLPGDCINATSFFGTADNDGNAIVNGDGDGLIHATKAGGTTYTPDDCINPDIDGEATQLFLHLNLAKLGVYTTKGQQTGGGGSPAQVGVAYPTVAYGNGTGLFVSCLLSNPMPANIFLRIGNIMVFGSGSGVGRINYASGLSCVPYGTCNGTIVNMGLPVEIIRRIDLKMDDGYPNTGKIGILSGETLCNTTVAAYPSASTSCKATAGKKVD